MKLEDQVTSLELSKKLKEAGYKQSGLWWWKHWVEKDLSHIAKDNSPYDYGTIVEVFVAPTVAELGETLPRFYGSWKNKVDWACRMIHELNLKFFRANTETNARAKMWLYLKKEGLLKEVKK